MKSTYSKKDLKYIEKKKAKIFLKLKNLCKESGITPYHLKILTEIFYQKYLKKLKKKLNQNKEHV